MSGGASTAMDAAKKAAYLMHPAKVTLILGIVWRHRIRYMVEQFLYKGKVEVRKVIESNIDKIHPMALRRIASEGILSKGSLRSAASVSAFNVKSGPDASPLAKGTSSTTLEVPLSASAKSRSQSTSSLPYMLAKCRMGTRLCGCLEKNPCTHKDLNTGEPLESYDLAYKDWRERMDIRAAASTLLWLATTTFVPPGNLRRAAAVLMQWMIAPVPQLIILYKVATVLQRHPDFTKNIFIARGIVFYLIQYYLCHKTYSIGHAMSSAAWQMRFPVVPPFVRSAGTARGEQEETKLFAEDESGPACLPALNRPTWSIITACVRETPRVTWIIFRFYALLFLVVRPLIRMKNPWRKRGQILKDLVGAVVTVSYARFAVMTCMLIRTENVYHLPFIHIARFLAVTLLAYGEFAVMPPNAGSDLFHAFCLANAIMSVGSNIVGYDIFRRLTCMLDPLLSMGTSAPLLSLT